jgi:hypothetical protein
MIMKTVPRQTNKNIVEASLTSDSQEQNIDKLLKSLTSKLDASKQDIIALFQQTNDPQAADAVEDLMHNFMDLVRGVKGLKPQSLVSKKQR